MIRYLPFVGGGGVDPGTTDPLFSQVLMLLHFDGANGSTTFTDSSSYARSVTAVNDAQISTSGALFDECGYFDNSSTADYIQTTDNTDFSLIVNQPFCIELAFNMGALNPNGSAVLLRISGVGAPQIVWVEVTDLGDITFVVNGASTLAALPISTGVMNRLCLDFDGTTLRLYMNGTFAAANLISGLSTLPTLVRLGSGDTSGFDACIDTRLDEFRITAGSRHTGSSYTLDTAPFPDS